jgi:phosphoadenosine phosphosulfate reductase
MTQTLITSNGTLITQSIDHIKKHQPKDGYYLAFSGGKDSIVCYDLLEKAGVDFEAHHAITSIDPKEVGIFLRKYYPEVERHHPTYKGEPTNFYKLVSMKGLPNRHVRWCCAYLKEVGGTGRTVVTGVRRAESNKRSGRLVYQKFGNKNILNPIVDWKDNDVWDLIHDNELPYPSLYDNGHDRIGCILCPLKCVHKRIRDYYEHPAHVRALERAIEIFLSTRPESGLWNWGSTPKEIILSWVTSTPTTDESGQCNLEGVTSE